MNFRGLFFEQAAQGFIPPVFPLPEKEDADGDRGSEDEQYVERPFKHWRG